MPCRLSFFDVTIQEVNTNIPATGKKAVRTAVQNCCFKNLIIVLRILYPKSVIRLAGDVSNCEIGAFGHLIRFCPHLAPHYAST